MPLALVYTSVANKALSASALDDILEVSRRNNAQCGITGVLLYGEQTFVQVLEGEPSAVNETLVRIEADERHSGLLTLCKKSTNARSFGDWSMGYEAAPPDAGAQGLFDLSRESLKSLFTDEIDHVVDQLVRAFFSTVAPHRST